MTPQKFWIRASKRVISRTLTCERTTSECAEHETSAYAIGEQTVKVLTQWRSGIQTPQPILIRRRRGSSSDVWRCSKRRVRTIIGYIRHSLMYPIRKHFLDKNSEDASSGASTRKVNGGIRIIGNIQIWTLIILETCLGSQLASNLFCCRHGEVSFIVNVSLFGTANKETPRIWTSHTTAWLHWWSENARMAWRRKLSGLRHTCESFLHKSLCRLCNPFRT